MVVAILLGMFYNVSQSFAICCKDLQGVARLFCKVLHVCLQGVVRFSNVLQCFAICTSCCKVLKVFQRFASFAMFCKALLGFAMFHNVLQRVAMCCNVLQCVAT